MRALSEDTRDEGPPQEPPPPYDPPIPRKDRRLDRAMHHEQQSPYNYKAHSACFLAMYLLPDVSLVNRWDLPWVGVIRVFTDNLPQVMREGFFWTPEDIREEENYIVTREQYVRQSNNDPWFENYRAYHIKDRRFISRWSAVLYVLSDSFPTLAKFDVRTLSTWNIVYATGLNATGHKVYDFDRSNPDNNMNAIYGDMPLAGWWPWPRGEYSDETGKMGLFEHCVQRVVEVMKKIGGATSAGEFKSERVAK